MSISVPVILRNVIFLRYPLRQVLKSVAGLGEIVLSVDPTSEDSSVSYVHELSKEFNTKVIYSVWDLNNISRKGVEIGRQTDIAVEACTGEFIFSVQADEALHEKDFDLFRHCASQSIVDAYSMTRLNFFGNTETVRISWSVPIVRFFRKGTRTFGNGDGMNTEGTGVCENLDNVFIYHYSRIGDPKIISSRIRALDGLFHGAEKLIPEDELPEYDFSTYNFDCFHKDTVDVGRQRIEGNQFIKFTGAHPSSFKDYK